MFIDPITEHEVLTEIDHSKLNESAGYDEFETKLSKAIKHEISQTSHTCF